jgi:hypothetical protein
MNEGTKRGRRAAPVPPNVETDARRNRCKPAIITHNQGSTPGMTRPQRTGSLKGRRGRSNGVYAATDTCAGSSPALPDSPHATAAHAPKRTHDSKANSDQPVWDGVRTRRTALSCGNPDTSWKGAPGFRAERWAATAAVSGTESQSSPLSSRSPHSERGSRNTRSGGSARSCMGMSSVNKRTKERSIHTHYITRITRISRLLQQIDFP